MTRGIFAKLAATNIRKNRKIYAPYIFACVGVVMMFYIICISHLLTFLIH